MLNFKNFNAINVIIIILLIAILVISIISVTKKVSCKSDVICPKPNLTCPKPICSPPEINLSCPEQCPNPCYPNNLLKSFKSDTKKIIYDNDDKISDKLKEKFYNNNKDLIIAIYSNTDLYDFYLLILNSNSDTLLINFMFLILQELKNLVNGIINDINRNNITGIQHTKNIVNIVYIIYLIQTYIKSLDGTIPQHKTPLSYYCSLIACNSSKSILQPPITPEEISSHNAGSNSSIFDSSTGEFIIDPDNGAVSSLINDCFIIMGVVNKTSINFSNIKRFLSFASNEIESATEWVKNDVKRTSDYEGDFYNYKNIDNSGRQMVLGLFTKLFIDILFIY